MDSFDDVVAYWEINKQRYARGGGGGMCPWSGRGAEDVGIRDRRMASPLSETRGLREVSAACDRDGVDQADSTTRFCCIVFEQSFSRSTN